MSRPRKLNKIIVKDNHAEVIITSPKRGIHIAVIDIDDVNKIKNHTWCFAKGYAYAWSVGQMHRLIMNYPPNKEIDHIDRNRLNNRKSNLRICTRWENQQNKETSNNEFPGISWHKRDELFYSRISVNGKRIYLGQFRTFIEALNARQDAINKYFPQLQQTG